MVSGEAINLNVYIGAVSEFSMSNEAVVVELYGQNNDGTQVVYSCASGTPITKGTLLQLTTPNIASAHSAVGQAIAGIASEDKASNDYTTRISVWTNGVFDMMASGATVGEPLEGGMSANVLSGTSATVGTLTPFTARETCVVNTVINVRLLI